MGFKTSIICITNPFPAIEDRKLLDEPGFNNYIATGLTDFDSAMYPGDESINIGTYNDCLVLADDYILTGELENLSAPEQLCRFEQKLSSLFPGSEILSVACNSTVNYHMYALVVNGRRVRYKRIADGFPVFEFGEKLKEEDEVYAYSDIINGERMFRSPYKDDLVYDMTEDQMMEDFAFGVAKRHLGVMISHSEDEELMETEFRKYLKPVKKGSAGKSALKENIFSRYFKKWLNI